MNEKSLNHDMNNGLLIGEGRRKNIYLDSPSGYVRKYFKTNLNSELVDEIKQQIEIKAGYLGKYMPKTSLEVDSLGELYIKQKYIKGKLLKDVDVKTLSPSQKQELVSLMEKYIDYCKKERKNPDFVGFQGIDNIFLAGFRLMANLPRNFLDSSNIIFSDSGEFYLVDVVEVPWLKSRLVYTIDVIVEKIVGIFVNQTLKKIKSQISSDVSDVFLANNIGKK